MTHVPSDVAFTAAVKAVQQQLGSRAMYARMEREGGWQTEVTDELADFIAGLDTFFLGTASAAGQPYIQHRGGPRGFLKVLDAHTLAFADFSGNRQYITAGNLSENPRAILFLIDYEAQRRIKVWGTAAVVADDPALLARLHDPSYRGRPERALLFTVQAWDVNCPQHIQPRVLASDVAPLLESLRARVVELEAEVARLRGQ
jgi:hypothetical protein